MVDCHILLRLHGGAELRPPKTERDPRVGSNVGFTVAEKTTRSAQKITLTLCEYFIIIYIWVE
jgi:hypothetical protein